MWDYEALFKKLDARELFIIRDAINTLDEYGLADKELQGAVVGELKERSEK